MKLIVLMLSTLVPSIMSYFADWSMLTRDSRQPTCVDIPNNMTLCHNIGYTKMRLPNLVDHDTLHEVTQQSMSWIPLLNIKCHVDTQLFLCSLFSPVCLERPIYPCRSLCQAVRAGCEGRMQAYGFPWPPMLDCDKFPLDNDMCITAQSVRAGAGDNSQEVETETKGQTRGQGHQSKRGKSCSGKPCDQHLTAENILDNFCRADFVVKVRMAKLRPRKMIGKKAQVFRAWKGTREEMRGLRNPKFDIASDERCCVEKAKRERQSRFLMMGKKPSNPGEDLKLTFMIPWTKSKEIKRARRMFKSMDCDNLRETSQKMIVDTFAPGTSRRGGSGRRRRGSRGSKTRASGERRHRNKSHVSIWDGIQ